MSGVILTTGVPGRWTEGVAPPPRLEIRELVKNEKMFSLYIQALRELYERSSSVDSGNLILYSSPEAMFKESQDKPISHFQIGGPPGVVAG